RVCLPLLVLGSVIPMDEDRASPAAGFAMEDPNGSSVNQRIQPLFAISLRFVLKRSSQFGPCKTIGLGLLDSTLHFLKREVGGTAGGVREPAAGARATRQALVEEARRVDRAVLCPLLRNRPNETNTPARAREHFEATVDSRLRVQLEPDFPPDSGSGNAAGVEESQSGPCFGVYVVADSGIGATAATG